MLQYGEPNNQKATKVGITVRTEKALMHKAAPQQPGRSGGTRQSEVRHLQRERKVLLASEGNEVSNGGEEDLGSGYETARHLDEMGQCTGEKGELGSAVEK